MDCSIQAQKLLLIAVKTPESMKNFAQKILEKNSCKWGIYRLIQKIAVGSYFCQNNTAGRPRNGQILNRLHCRSTAPVDRIIQRAELLLVGRPPRSTDILGCRRAQVCVRRSTVTVDRLHAVDRYGRPN